MGLDMTLRLAMTATVLAAGGLFLAGCDGPSAFAPTHFGFYFNQDGPDANLAYGEAQSDNVGLMLQCSKGSRQVQLTDVASAKPEARLVLTSGGQRLALSAKQTIDPTGASLAQAALPLDAPVLRGFRDSGEMAVNLGPSHYGLRARHEEKAAVMSFFTACEKS